jgi:hypothetical protein
MPLNMNNPVVLAELRPPQLIDLGTWLKAYYGVGPTSFGIKGDENHLSGYHRSFNTLTQVPGANGWDDYSIQNTLDNTNLNRNDCCAADLTPGVWGSAENRARMIGITTRMYNAAKANDPRIRQCREFAGTLNGTSVIRFRCDGGAVQSPFDSSHLHHGHWSFWRSRVRWNHAGLFQVITGGTAVASGDTADFAASNVLTPEGAIVGSHVALSRLLAESKANKAMIELVASKVDITPEELATIAEAARQGAQQGSSGATPEEVRQAVDAELDEAFGAAKDTDS